MITAKLGGLHFQYLGTYAGSISRYTWLGRNAGKQVRETAVYLRLFGDHLHRSSVQINDVGYDPDCASIPSRTVLALDHGDLHIGL